MSCRGRLWCRNYNKHQPKAASILLFSRRYSSPERVGYCLFNSASFPSRTTPLAEFIVLKISRAFLVSLSSSRNHGFSVQRGDNCHYPFHCRRQSKYPIQQPLHIHVIRNSPGIPPFFAFHKNDCQVFFVIKMRYLAVFTNATVAGRFASPLSIARCKCHAVFLLLLR